MKTHKGQKGEGVAVSLGDLGIRKMKFNVMNVTQ